MSVTVTLCALPVHVAVVPLASALPLSQVDSTRRVAWLATVAVKTAEVITLPSTVLMVIVLPLLVAMYEELLFQTTALLLVP